MSFPLVGHDERITPLTSITRTEQTRTVYNLRVSEDHTYFVGSAKWGFSIWVHNAYAAKLDNGVWKVRDLEEFPGPDMFLKEMDGSGNLRDIVFDTEKEAIQHAKDLNKGLAPWKVPKNWAPQDIANPRWANGCENVAEQIRKLIGAAPEEVKTILPKPATRRQFLGEFMGFSHRWKEHVVVVKNGRVYDAFTGHKGLTISEYKRRWTDAGAIEFSF